MSLFKKAIRRDLRLRMLLMGLPGSGKTMTALRVARGLVGPQGRIAVIDTDSGAAATKYADMTDADGQVLEFDHLPLGEAFGSFDTVNYIKALRAAVAEGYDAVIIDSLTHAWSGKGGILEQKDRMGGKFNAWGKLTPKHRELVEALVNAETHVIATVRSKQQWTLDERGRPEQAGMGADQRNGLEYEFDVVGEIDQDTHRMAVTKSRCAAISDRTFDRPGKDFADELRVWLEGGDAPPREAPKPFDLGEAVGAPLELIQAVCAYKGWGNPAEWGEAKARQFADKYDRDAVAAIAKEAADEMRGKFFGRAKELGEGEAWDADRKAVLQAWYGVDSAGKLTLRHALGEHGLRFLDPRNSDAFAKAWAAVTAAATAAAK